MNFSIILPSRERLELLTGLLQSIADTTDDLSRVEVHIAIDADDTPTLQAANGLQESFPFAHFAARLRSPNLNKDYINWVADHGTGRFIIVCNDDCAFRTKHWDTIALAKLNDYLADKPDGVVYGYVSDALLDRHNMGYCCFPLLSRRAKEVLGWAIPPEYTTWGSDIALWNVFRSIGRICDLSEIMIEHISYHAGTRARDGISYRVEHLSWSNAHFDSGRYATLLQQAIQEANVQTV